MPDLDEIRSLAEFRSLLREFLHFSENAAIECDILPQHHQLLLQIAGAPEESLTTVEYLAGRLSLRHNSVVELTKRCEEAGLVSRTRNEDNRRQVVLGLTREGWNKLRKLSEAHSRELNILGPQLIPLLFKLTGTPAKDNLKRAGNSRP